VTPPPFPVPRPVVTGATGFVGARVAALLGEPVTARLGAPEWREAVAALDLAGATVIHLAARVHAPGATEAEFDADNVAKTAALAQAAADAGAARFVFASTVKVFGEESGARPFTEADAVDPRDAYARSKWRAEQALADIARARGLPVVVLRIPLVYGPGAGGNFRALARLADTAWWLPLGAIANRRSVVQVDDLAQALVAAAGAPGIGGRTYAVAHPEPMSTTRLVEAMRRALGRPRRLFAVPPALLEAAGALAGRGDRVRRLTRSLEVDAAAFSRDTGWRARVGLEDGVADALRGAAA
jgi:nucleoside-diphosphate-sugar epimerase